MATIFALSSGAGRAGVAVIRVSGTCAWAAVEALAPPIPAPRIAVLRTLYHPDTREPLDRALVLVFRGPHSATGEDMAEFHVHGGRAVVQAVLSALGCVAGCRPAEAGEFTRRAFENGKMDLTAVEGLADLIDAETEAQHRQALRQSSGALGHLYDGWRMDLIGALALVEAAIDFADEGDVGERAYSGARPLVERLYTSVSAHLADSNRGEIVREGFQVVLAGPPNVGKSSLLNALTRRDVAIVSEEAGTTRDVIEVRLDLGGFAVVLSDTAGLREAQGAIEREGIRRTLERARQADLMIWLMDAEAPSADLPAEAPERVLWVANKVDRHRPDFAALPEGTLALSAKTGEGLTTLTERLTALVGESATASGDLVPTQARHRLHLIDTLTHLNAFLTSEQHDFELRAEDLRLAAQSLGRLTGRVDPEDVLDRIFSRFCVGK
ncbi:MAG: tRNA uridine-5-carboxymethylaminomethyl(34) synthesis GTPase MnmE [Hyphomicrobiaceae bacterium]